MTLARNSSLQNTFLILKLDQLAISAANEESEFVFLGRNHLISFWVPLRLQNDLLNHFRRHKSTDQVIGIFIFFVKLAQLVRKSY